uniref:Nuclear pore protein n=1 Tax=Glossina pallidipes TaxID=7398 RepID=A0A1A9ZUH8_GLOPL
MITEKEYESNANRSSTKTLLKLETSSLSNYSGPDSVTFSTIRGISLVNSYYQDLKRARKRHNDSSDVNISTIFHVNNMDFNSLVQEAQRLNNETQYTEEVPRAKLTISQVLQATNELHARVTQIESQDVQAQQLLGSKGIDLSKISKKLESLSARSVLEPLNPISETDVENFLKNEKENAILSVIEEVNKNGFQLSQKRRWEHVKAEWRDEKVKIMNTLGSSSHNWIGIENLPEQTVINETVDFRSCLNNIEMAYAREVHDYNAVVIKGAFRPNLVQKFSEIAKNFKDSNVCDIWEIMKYMVDVTPVSRHRDPLQSRNRIKQFVEQAKKYLENRYKLYMSSIIGSNLREAQRGGIPSTFNLVSAFVGLNFNKSNCFYLQGVDIDGRPLWPMVYYCLRCGDMRSALRCLLMGRAGHEDFIQLLEDKINKSEQKINSKLEEQLKMHYFNEIKNSTDPYKKAVYCIGVGCDINDQHVEVVRTTDDFLWMQLSILRHEAAEHSESLTYSGLQVMILEKYGEKHFNANEQQHLYFQVLALTGQFEAAIEFLARSEKYRAHAVHIGLALNEMMLIEGPRNIEEPLLSIDIKDSVPKRRLNLARLIMLYVKRFEMTDPAEALHYYYFLRNLKDSDGRNLFLVCVSHLATESRNYDLLFGRTMPNGVPSGGGLLQQFDCVNFDSRTAANIIGDELVRKGMFEDAIKLYDLAGMQSYSLRYLCLLLSQVVHQSSKKGSLRERLAILVTEYSERLRGSRIECEAQIIATFNLLSQLISFFDYYHECKYQVALEILAKTKLVPSSMGELEESLNNFKGLGSEIIKVYPDILLAKMDILYSQYKMLKGKDTGMLNRESDSRLQHLRQQAKALTNMAATIPYRMPGDTNRRLVQTEILMN